MSSPNKDKQEPAEDDPKNPSIINFFQSPKKENKNNHQIDEGNKELSPRLELLVMAKELDISNLSNFTLGSEEDDDNNGDDVDGSGGSARVNGGLGDTDELNSLKFSLQNVNSYLDSQPLSVSQEKNLENGLQENENNETNNVGN